MTQTKLYDLEERTAKFAENIIKLCRLIPLDTITKPIINQLVRAGTSIGANYCEANGASSKKDFKNKIYICKKESKETMYWLRILSNSVDGFKDKCKENWKEAHELTLIFSKIATNTK
ncbi:MAG: four helix bundle protein [Candidatus Levyibacteriota bacterium]